eukprot:5429649-Amphidinium_carterae.1
MGVVETIQRPWRKAAEIDACPYTNLQTEPDHQTGQTTAYNPSEGHKIHGWPIFVLQVAINCLCRDRG